MGDTFLTLTNFDYLTKHITLKLFPFLILKGAYLYYLLLVYLLRAGVVDRKCE